MNKSKDMRKVERDDFDTPISYSDDNFHTHHRALMHNFSDNGMYLESDVPLKPGSEVYIKTEDFRSINRCEVKWCNKLEDDDSGSEHFGIGLQCEI